MNPSYPQRILLPCGTRFHWHISYLLSKTIFR